MLHSTQYSAFSAPTVGLRKVHKSFPAFLTVFFCNWPISLAYNFHWVSFFACLFVHTHPSEESLADLPVPRLLLADGHFLVQIHHWYRLLKSSLIHKSATHTFSDKQNCFYASNTQPGFVNHPKCIFFNRYNQALSVQIKLQMCCFLICAQVTPPDKSAGRGQTEA